MADVGEGLHDPPVAHSPDDPHRSADQDLGVAAPPPHLSQAGEAACFTAFDLLDVEPEPRGDFRDLLAQTREVGGPLDRLRIEQWDPAAADEVRGIDLIEAGEIRGPEAAVPLLDPSAHRLEQLFVGSLR